MMNPRGKPPVVWAVLEWLETAIGLGLASGAAVAAALGRLLLAGILGAAAVGLFLRFKRGRANRRR